MLVQVTQPVLGVGGLMILIKEFESISRLKDFSPIRAFFILGLIII